MTELPRELVHVISPESELTESISGWLRNWGARPYIGCPSIHEGTEQGHLLEIHTGPFKQRLEPHWSGSVIVASSDAPYEPQLMEGGWQVKNLSAIQQALSRAQGLRPTQPYPQHQQRSLRKLSLHILVVEDDVINQLILRDQLEELGCTVALTCDGEETLSTRHVYRLMYCLLVYTCRGSMVMS